VVVAEEVVVVAADRAPASSVMRKAIIRGSVQPEEAAAEDSAMAAAVRATRVTGAAKKVTSLVIVPTEAAAVVADIAAVAAEVATAAEIAIEDASSVARLDTSHGNAPIQEVVVVAEEEVDSDLEAAVAVIVDASNAARKAIFPAIAHLVVAAEEVVAEDPSPIVIADASSVAKKDTWLAIAHLEVAVASIKRSTFPGPALLLRRSLKQNKSEELKTNWVLIWKKSVCLWNSFATS